MYELHLRFDGESKKIIIYRVFKITELMTTFGITGRQCQCCILTANYDCQFNNIGITNFAYYRISLRSIGLNKTQSPSTIAPLTIVSFDIIESCLSLILPRFYFKRKSIILCFNFEQL